MSNRNLFSMNILSVGNAALSSDRVIQFLLAIYLSFSLIYTLPLVGNIIIFKQSFFLLLVAFLMFYKHSYKKLIYFFSLIVLISIFQLNVLLNTSFEGNIKFLYLISTAIFFIIYLKEDYLEKYFTKSIIVITLFSALYIFYSYNPNYLKYDIRTYTFGTYSTNWSIGLAFIILYSIKKNISFTFISIIYYAQLISGGRAGILTTIVGCLILFSMKKEYYKLLLILILTVSYDFIKPTHWKNGNSNRQYIFFQYKSQLDNILSDLNPINNFPGLIAKTKIEKTKIEEIEKAKLVRFSSPLYASSAREGATADDERKNLLREISRLKNQSTRFETLVEETEQKILAIEEKFRIEDFYRDTTPEEVRKLKIKKRELSEELSGHLMIKTRIEKQKKYLISSREKIGIDKPEPSKEDIQKELFDVLQKTGMTVDNRKVRIDHLELREGIYVLVKNPMVIGSSESTTGVTKTGKPVNAGANTTMVPDSTLVLATSFSDAATTITITGGPMPKTDPLRVGMVVTGTGIPSGTTIISIASATTVVLSASTTVAGRHDLTFSNNDALYSMLTNDAEAKVISIYGGIAKWRGEYVRVGSRINISNADAMAVSEDNKRFYIVHPKTLASSMYLPLELKFKKIEGYQHNLDGWILDIPFFNKIDLLAGYRLQQIMIGLRLFKDKIFGRDFDTAGRIHIKNGQSFELHNTFFFHSIRGGLFFSLIYIFLIYTSIKTSDKMNRAFLCCGLIPSFFEPYVLIGGYNMCFLWWIVYAKSISNQLTPLIIRSQTTLHNLKFNNKR